MGFVYLIVEMDVDVFARMVIERHHPGERCIDPDDRE